MISLLSLRHHEVDGITTFGFASFSEDYGFEMKNCEIFQTQEEYRSLDVLDSSFNVELGKLHIRKFPGTSTTFCFFDKRTITERLLKNDMSIFSMLDAIAAAQIAELLDLAIEKGCEHCVAELMDLRHERFPDVDPDAYFTLDLRGWTG